MDPVLLPQFWIPLLEIIGVDILLSGDNAVVIALAVRSLPQRQQGKAIVFGSVAAVVMRVILTIFVVEMLRLPYLKLVGSVLLLWIGIKLQLPQKAMAARISRARTLCLPRSRRSCWPTW